jgi:hypothetical protein
MAVYDIHKQDTQFTVRNVKKQSKVNMYTISNSVPVEQWELMGESLLEIAS